MEEYKYYEYGDFSTFMQDEGRDRLFRLLVYRRIFTPYEQENKFMDESDYEEQGSYKFVFIKEVINLTNDILLGCQEVDIDMGQLFDTITYYKLSEIRLSWREADIKTYLENAEYISNNTK